MHRPSLGITALSLFGLLAAPAVGSSLRQGEPIFLPDSEPPASEPQSTTLVSGAEVEPPCASPSMRPDEVQKSIADVLLRYGEFVGVVSVHFGKDQVTESQGVFRGRKLEPDTVFPIGSLAKLFGAVWLLQREERANEDNPDSRVLDRALSELRPELVWGRLASATPRHLLHHQAGIVGPADLKVDPWDGEKYFGKFIELESARGRSLAPGSRAIYSNVGFALAGYLVEQDCNKLPTSITEGILSGKNDILFWGDKRFADAAFNFADAGSVRVKVRDQFQKTPSWNNLLANGMLASAPALTQWQQELFIPSKVLAENGLAQLMAADASGFGAGCMVRRLPNGDLVIANTGSDRDGNPAFLAGTRNCSVAVLSCLGPRSGALRTAYSDQALVVFSAAVALVGDLPVVDPTPHAPRYIGTYSSVQGSITIALDVRNPERPHLTISAAPSEVVSALTSRGFDQDYQQRIREIALKFVKSGFVEGDVKLEWRADLLDWSGFLHGGQIPAIFRNLESFLDGSKGKVEIAGVRPTLQDQTIHTVFLKDAIGNYLGLVFSPEEVTGAPVIVSSQWYPANAAAEVEMDGKALQGEGLHVKRALVLGASGAMYFFDGEARVPVARLSVDDQSNLHVAVAGYPEFVLPRKRP